MINEENKRFLIEKFNIDVNKYSTTELNKKLDEILKIVNKEVINKIKELKSILEDPTV